MTEDRLIFLVDDDPINNMINKQLLNRVDADWKSKDFLTVREALDTVSKGLNEGEEPLPTIIFLDINMPVLNGWDFLDEYQNLPANFRDECRLFILSSSIDKQDIQTARQYQDVRDYLTKPLTKDVLRDILEVNA